MTSQGEDAGVVARQVGLVERLLADVVASFKLTAADRARLHRLELDQRDRIWSLLGEVETRDGRIAGVAQSFCKRRDGQVLRDYKEKLPAYGVVSCPRICEWIVENGTEFEFFMAYLRNLELLRFVLQELAGDAQTESAPA